LGKMQRNKGAGFEREIAKSFQAHGFDARRGGMSQSRKKGSEADVVVSGLDDFWIEAKRGAKEGGRPNPGLRQAALAGGGKTPLWVGRLDHEKAVAAMYLDDFLKLLRRVYPDAVIQSDVELDRDQNHTNPNSGSQGTLDFSGLLVDTRGSIPDPGDE